jgi:hypothetical protein
MSRLRTLIRHYSAWALWALAAVGGLWTYIPEFRDSLPPWLVTALAIAGLVAKLIPQTPPPTEGRERWSRPW